MIWEGARKACAEIAISSYSKSILKDPSIINTARSGNVIGGGDWAENRLIPDAAKSFINKQKLLIRNPRHIRPWQHVLDPIFGYLLICEKLAKGEINKYDSWNLGPLNRDMINVETLIEMLAKDWPSDFSFEMKNTKHNLKETTTLTLDSTKASVGIGWQPKLNFQKSIELTAKWYLNYFNHNGSMDSVFSYTAQQVDEYLEL